MYTAPPPPPIVARAKLVACQGNVQRRSAHSDIYPIYFSYGFNTWTTMPFIIFLKQFGIFVSMATVSSGIVVCVRY